jgi:hypothetical protein
MRAAVYGSRLALCGDQRLHGIDRRAERVLTRHGARDRREKFQFVVFERAHTRRAQHPSAPFLVEIVTPSPVLAPGAHAEAAQHSLRAAHVAWRRSAARPNE